ncbi:hypothetical protein P4K96_04135 [Bacillus cereus]|nr:hypothetical protein [Bacillus cereus]
MTTNANKYIFVWGKHKAKLQDKVKTLFASIEEAERQEEQELQGQDLRELGESGEVTNEKLEKVVEHSNRLQTNCSGVENLSVIFVVIFPK